MLSFIRGSYAIELIGASVERCFSRWAGSGIPFWEITRSSEISARCRLRCADLYSAQDLAERSQCELKILSEHGLPQLLRRLRARPILCFGTLLAVLAAFYFNRFVWFVQVNGNERVPEAVIRNVLFQEGVRFGASGEQLDCEFLKNRLLLNIPELRWLAVNREGGVVRVSVAEREKEEKQEETVGICDLAATRSGIIRELHVINGFAQVECGDAVSAGDILISGVMEWPTHIQATHAEGEVYAETFRDFSLSIPDQSVQKRYTGRTETCVDLIFQRKRINLSGNSGIFGIMCDTMIEIEQIVLPGGYELPVSIEKRTLLEYEPLPEAIGQEAALRLLSREAERLIRAQMISGRIEAGTTTIQKKQNSYLCRAAMNCLELISGTVPAELFGEEEKYGEIDQR